MTPTTSPLGRLREHPHLRRHLVLILAQVALAVWVVWFGVQHPEPGFTVSTDAETGALVVDSVDPAYEGRADRVQPGDVVLAVGDRAVDNRAELWHALADADDDEVELSVRRFDISYQMTLRPEQFSGAGIADLPAGVREDDLAVALACQDDGPLVELKAVDLEALAHLVRERSTDEQGVTVFFRRPSDEELVTASLDWPPLPLALGGLVLLGVGLMLIALTQSARRVSFMSDGGDTRDVYLSALVLCATLAAVALSAGPQLIAQPLMLVVAAGGLALFKPIDFEYHLRERSSWAPLERFTRLAVYIAPLIFFAQMAFFGVAALRMTWGGDLGPEDVARIDRLWLMLAATTGLLVLIEGALVLVRHARRGEDGALGVTASRIGLGFSVMFVLTALYLYVNQGDVRLAGLAMTAALGAQLLGDIVAVVELPRAYWRPAQHEALSAAPVARFLARCHALFPDDEVYLLMARTAFDKQVVRVRLDETGTGELALRREISPEPWTDLVDLLETEGGTVPRVEHSDDDPVTGIAAQLGVVLAWPLARDVAGTNARITLIVARSQPQLEPGWQPPTLHDLPAAQLDELLGAFGEVAPALVFQAVEVAPVAVPPALPAVARREPRPERPAAPPRGPRRETPAATSDPDLDAVDSEEIDVSPSRRFRVLNSETIRQLEDFELENEQLRAQVRALEADIERLHPVADAETTPAQREAALKIAHVGAPILLVGEAGVGKTLVARMAHEEMGGGPFVRLSATQMPETVLAFEVFGNDEHAGRLVAALGGTLLIEGADRLGPSLVDELLDEVEALDEAETVRVLFAIDAPTDESALAEFDAECDELTRRADAEVVVVPPLREQTDTIPALADYFVHRAAMRHARLVTGIDEAAVNALQRHSWPGNFREFRDVLERAVLVCGGRDIGLDDLQLDFGAWRVERGELRQRIDDLERDLAHGVVPATHGPDLDALRAQLTELEGRLDQSRLRAEQAEARAESLAATIAALEEDDDEEEDEGDEGDGHDDHDTGDDGASAPAVDELLSQSYEEIEAQLLEHALRRAGGNKSQAARDLGLKRSTFINKLKKYDLG